MKWITLLIFGIFGLGWYSLSFPYAYDFFAMQMDFQPYMDWCKNITSSSVCSLGVYLGLYTLELPVLLPIYFVFSLAYLLVLGLRQVGPANTLHHGLVYSVVFLAMYFIFGGALKPSYVFAVFIVQFIAMSSAFWLARHLTSSCTGLAKARSVS